MRDWQKYKSTSVSIHTGARRDKRWYERVCSCFNEESEEMFQVKWGGKPLALGLVPC